MLEHLSPSEPVLNRTQSLRCGGPRPHQDLLGQEGVFVDLEHDHSSFNREGMDQDLDLDLVLDLDLYPDLYPDLDP